MAILTIAACELGIIAAQMPVVTNDPSRAQAALSAGQPVALATETVYGLAARADNDDAVRRVFELKGRPADHPLIIHLASADQIDYWASPVASMAKELARRFWPGPLTMVLPRRPERAKLAAGGRDTIALRVPAHPVAHQLLERLDTALAAPSANRFGRPSPTCAQHVVDDFSDTDLMVLDCGPTELGIESTVVDLCDAHAPLLLRPGALAREQIEQVTGSLGSPAGTGGAPGTLAAHYAPRQPLLLLDDERYAQACADHPKDTVAALGFACPKGVADKHWRKLANDPVKAAHELFALMRELENTDTTLIAAQALPDEQGWQAVADRLRRAANANA